MKVATLLRIANWSEYFIMGYDEQIRVTRNENSVESYKQLFEKQQKYESR